MNLQTKVISLIIPVVLFVVATCGIIGFTYLNEDLNESFNFKNEQIVKQTKNYINSYNEQRVKSLEFVSNLDIIHNFIKKTGQVRYSEHQQELIELFDKSLKNNKNVQEYFILNNKKEFLFTYSRDIFYEDQNDKNLITKYFKNYNLKKGKILVTYENFSVGKRILYIKRISSYGYIVMTENTNFFNDFLNMELASNNALFLIKDDVIINKNIDSLNENHLKNYKYITQNVIEDDISNSNSNSIKINVSSKKEYNKESYYTYLSKNKENGFAILSIISGNEQDSVLIDFALSMTAFVIILAAVVSFCLILLMKKIIILPISKITKASEFISKGSYDLNLGKDRNDEISVLSNTLSEVCVNIVNSNKKINKMAYFDQLTGLPNKRNFETELKEKFHQAEFNDEEICVMLMDLDDFKEINDSFGHDLGDDFLKSIANKLQMVIKKTIAKNNYNLYSHVSRIAGDDFVVLLKGNDLKNISAHIADELLKNIADKIFLGDKSVYPSATIGIALYPEQADTMDKLFQYADMAMYESKKQGKNQFSYITNKILDHKKEQELLSKEIKEALNDDDFYLQFQPKKNLKTGKYKDFEALIRWNHKEKGFISPGVFIPFAEKSNLIVKIGDWVILNVCKHIKTLEELGWTDFKISFNVSYKQMQEKSFIPYLESQIKKHKINPKHLEMEITEHTIVKDLEQTLIDLKKIRELGLSVSLDDFGTGYSSLIYLQTLPLDILKIDRAFICKSVESKESQAIIKTIITLAQGLGMKTVAEGVETKEELDLLTSYGCDYIQGFYLYRPLDFGKIIEVDQKENYKDIE
jgi:diguanylate cyclase (GGDEF)-like protein